MNNEQRQAEYARQAVLVAQRIVAWLGEAGAEPAALATLASVTSSLAVSQGFSLEELMEMIGAVADEMKREATKDGGGG